ncbi:hypothetical protein PVK06_016500 [Gossypium arboreum]|uniref:Uncharacterized protein n=1 Tax=Gossypium arboreum TaxID=29729 RepID=A0ABR0Q0Y9_GOSAR|nr:hypothetical protein PVK06_016500 [Gossypium arboreum]
MALGGSACKEVVEAQSPVADNDIASTTFVSNTTSTTTTTKSAVNLVGKHGARGCPKAGASKGECAIEEVLTPPMQECKERSELSVRIVEVKEPRVKVMRVAMVERSRGCSSNGWSTSIGIIRGLGFGRNVGPAPVLKAKLLSVMDGLANGFRKIILESDSFTGCAVGYFCVSLINTYNMMCCSGGGSETRIINLLPSFL